MSQDEALLCFLLHPSAFILPKGGAEKGLAPYFRRPNRLMTAW
jgi:hypothetical protein